MLVEYAKAWLALKVDRRAVTALEYGMIAALIAGIIVAGVTALGGKLNTEFLSLSSAV